MILRQDIAWHDSQSAGQLITQLTHNVDQIEGGIGDRIGNFIQNVVRAIAYLVIALTMGWKLTIASLSLAPFLLGSFAILVFSLRRYSIKELNAYEEAGRVAAEVLTAIRTVFAFGSQEKETRRYERQLSASARVFAFKSGFMGIGEISFS